MSTYIQSFLYVDEKICNRHSTNKYQQKYVNNCIFLIVIELKLRKFIFSKKSTSKSI